MPSADGAVGVRLSLYEWLTDLNPRVSEETPRERWAGIDDLRGSVLDNLHAILNTRRTDTDIDPEFRELSESVYNFGVVDFTSLSPSDPGDREKLRRSIERAVRLFEPRLSHIRVKVNEPDPRKLGLYFHIDALLRVEPENEPVAFDAVLARGAEEFRLSVARE
jgi:type VI secretion system protein ImpF